MSIPAFTQGYPPDGSSLGQTKSFIRDNLDGTYLTLGVDHINNNGQPGMQPAGYHTIIHQVPQTNVSTLMPTGYNQVFSGVPGTLIVNGVTTPAIPSNGDSQLYALSAQGGLSQLTGARKANRGFAWVGGILLQWGIVSSTGTTGNVNFTTGSGVNFPSNVFNIQLSSSNNTGNPQTNTIYNLVESSLTNSGFTWVANNANGQTLYWFAIGN